MGGRGQGCRVRIEGSPDSKLSPSHQFKDRRRQVDGRLNWRVRCSGGEMVRLEQGRGARRGSCRAAEQRLRKEREECGVRSRQQRRGGWKVRMGRWQSCSVRATTIEACVVVSQDNIGTVNMVVMGKGELIRGRVSADIWAAHERRMAVSPTTAWPLSQARTSSALDAYSLAWRCCVMQRSTSMRIGRAAPGRIDTGSFAISRHQGSGQAGRGAANFLAACCPRPHWLHGCFRGPSI